jgi:hypothetical protein
MGVLYQVCMERGREIHPGEASIAVLLGGQDICNEMVPVEEPPRLKNVLNIEYGELVIGVNGWSNLLLPQRGRRGRGCRLSPLRGRGRGRVRVRKSTWSRHDGGKKARSCASSVSVQQG